PPGLVEAAPDGCELVYAGKLPDRHVLPQAEINALLVDRALAGGRVVRLKGGDPFVFGRGAEEAEACAAAGVPFEVVPGVSSAVAVPAYAGIPATHRDLSSAFAVVTGHEDPAKEAAGALGGAGPGARWEALAQIGTVCVLMGVERLAAIAARLVEAGRAPDTPAAVIEQGTTPAQRVVRATLATIAGEAGRAGVRSPAVVVIGEVVALRDRIAWYETRPLFGRTVLVPRTREQAGALSELLRERGAEPLEVATIEVRPPSSPAELDRAVGLLAAGRFDWVVLTSANGVAALRGRVEATGLDARALGGTLVAAVGPATEAALRSWGIAADLVPGVATTAALGEAFPASPGRVLLPRADLATPDLSPAIEAKGGHPDDVVAYRTVPLDDMDPAARKRLDGGEVDWVAFTAASTVTGFVRAYGGPPPAGVRAAAIGPVTAAAAEASGVRVDALAAEHTIPGLVAAIERAVAGT
ncbi:MAG TPA: uroporphyrinogen-III C-methyltransferase, partial [Actinomycetota bacterium]|nr:uroporphyrinogen-III C-methyltransferase [Actinomycetota bacterium]